MKNLIIIAIVSLITSFANAEDFFTIQGKKISLHEQRSDMIAKFGPPSNYHAMGENWTIGDKAFSTAFDKWGIENLRTNKGSVTINGQTFTIGKTNLSVVKSKLGRYCYQIENDIAGRNEYLSARVGAEGEINIIIGAFTTNRKVSDKGLDSLPISTLQLTYEDPLSNPTCKY